MLVQPILQVARGRVALTLIPAIGGTCIVCARVWLNGIGRTNLPWAVALRLTLILRCGILRRRPARIRRDGIRRTHPRLWPALHLRSGPWAALRPAGLRTLRTRRGRPRSRLGTLAVSPRRGRAQSHKQSNHSRATLESPTSRVVCPVHKRLPSLFSQLTQSPLSLLLESASN
jgi:hypothetical protein